MLANIRKFSILINCKVQLIWHKYEGVILLCSDEVGIKNNNKAKKTKNATKHPIF